MKILQVSKKFPYPIKDGESLAIINMAKGMNRNGAEVSLLAMNTLKHFFQGDNALDELKFYQEVTKIFIDNRLKLQKFIFNFFGKDSSIAKKYNSKSFEKVLIEILQKSEFDVIQLESIFLAQYIPIIKRHSKALISLRTHNVESLIWERMAKNSGLLKRWIYQRVSQKLQNFEKLHLSLPDFIIPISKPDKEVFSRWNIKTKSLVLPVGIDLSLYKEQPFSPFSPVKIGFIGALDWLPNIQGLNWFIKNVWKKFHLHEVAQLHVAGRNMPDVLKRKTLKNIIFHGDVPVAIDFIRENNIMIVPLLSGSGMRVKILEGMALGKVVVTSSLGAEGIPVTHGKNIMIANTPASFAESINKLVKEELICERIGVAARSLIQTNFSNKKLGEQLISYYHQHLFAKVT